jgi:TP901 family phage tail tape measure protein
VSVVANVAINIDGKQAQSLLKAIQGEVEKLNGSFDQIPKKTGGIFDKLKGAASSAIGQLAAITGAAVTLRQAFTTLADQSKAEGALRTLGVDADVATQQFTQLSKELKGQASVVELTAAAYDVASAGFLKTADQTKILEAATKGAVGGMSDINTVGNAVTSVLNAYGMSADQAGLLVDGFIQTQNDGKIVLAEYAALVGRLAPLGAAAGVGIKELNAAVATITAQGVKPEAAVTGLAQAISSILKPTSEAQKLAKELGIDFTETGLRSKGLGGFLNEVATATGGSSSKLTQLFGSLDAVKALLPLLSGDMKKFVENILKQDEAAGVATKAFNDMANTLGGALKEVDTAFKNLVVAFKPITPAIIAPFKVLAGAVNLVTENIKALAAAKPSGCIYWYVCFGC